MDSKDQPDGESRPRIHPHALVEPGAAVGPRTRVWAFAHVLPGAVVGADCNICDHTFLEGGVRLGDRVTVKCGVYLWDGVVAEDDVFIGPCVAFTNDLRPRSRCHPDRYLGTLLKRGCALGANSTVLPVTVGQWSMVAAGSVVTREVPDHALVVGNPARFRAWICRCGAKLPEPVARVLTCACGRRYEQVAAEKLVELEA